jgi:hypothetical protein
MKEGTREGGTADAVASPHYNAPSVAASIMA